MISKTSLLLTLLTLPVNLVSAVTQAQCVALCNRLQKYSSYSSASYNGIGVYNDNCICKNPENANMPLTCRKYSSPASTSPYIFHGGKTGNWRCNIYSTCETLEQAINRGIFKPYDYYNIGKIGDKCSIYMTGIYVSTYFCQKFKTAYTGTSPLYYSPATTGLWQCKKS